MRDDLRLAHPKIPVFDAGHKRDILDAVPLCPFQRRCRRPVSLLTGADFLEDSVRDQDGGSKTLDQIEPADACEQNEW